jgi:ElaB/YqjD/DUF883 family membrane-anchored ribosome-binding protein
MDDLKSASDEELESIIRRATNTRVDGSQFQRASIELELRRNRRIFEQQERLYSTVQSKANRIIRLLNRIGRKPFYSAVIAAIVAIFIGVSVNLLSAWLEKVLGLN